MLCLEIVSFYIEPDATADIDLRASAKRIGALQISALYDCAVARESCKRIVRAAQTFNERTKAASRSKRDARSYKHGVMLNRSCSGKSGKLDRLHIGKAAAELAGNPQPATEM